MPYLSENEIMISDKAASSNSSTSDVEEDGFIENKTVEAAGGYQEDDEEATNSSASSDTSGDSPSRKRKHFDPDAVIATALNYLSTSEPARDELWQFMSYLHTVLKNLPSHLQLQLKNKIQKAMCEVEKQDANDTENNATDKDVVPDQ